MRLTENTLQVLDEWREDRLVKVGVGTAEVGAVSGSTEADSVEEMRGKDQWRPQPKKGAAITYVLAWIFPPLRGEGPPPINMNCHPVATVMDSSTILTTSPSSSIALVSQIQ
jgi:hypothetical protein